MLAEFEKRVILNMQSLILLLQWDLLNGRRTNCRIHDLQFCLVGLTKYKTQNASEWATGGADHFSRQLELHANT
jgi:hypothetical protein